MRALFVAPYLPTPGSGGRTRLLNLMERLSRTHDLRVVAFRANDQHDIEVPYPGAALLPRPLRSRPGGARGLAAFYRERFEVSPAFVSQMWSEEFVASLRAQCEQFQPDVVQIETTEMAQYLAHVPPSHARVLDLQDVASRWFGRVARQGVSGKQRGLLMLELLKTRRYEVASTRQADVVFVTSPVERAHLGGLTGITPVEIPNGVDTTSFVPMPEVAEHPESVLFVGPLTYDANLIGLQWFARDVLPLILREIPSLVVDHIGDAAGHSIEGITHHGFVADTRPYVARSPVSIVPVRVGSGTRYKILEALSMARAVVSTTVGAEGLGVRDGLHLSLADEPASFARSLIRLLHEPQLRMRLGAAGRTHIVERYDWEPLVARVESSWGDAARLASIRNE